MSSRLLLHKLDYRAMWTAERCSALTEKEESLEKTYDVLRFVEPDKSGLAESKRETPTERLDVAGKVLRNIMATPATGIAGEVLNRAKCIAVVPHMLEGGFIVGAESGSGVATCRIAAGMERASVLYRERRQCWTATRCRRRGYGHDLPE